MSSKRKAAAVSAMAVGGSGGPSPKRRKLPEIIGETAEGTTKAGLTFVEHLKNARDGKDRPIVTHFLTLPDKKKLPQYYEKVGLPMSLDIIEDKLNRQQYPNLAGLESDLKRIIGNAKTFNSKSSPVFSDAEKVRKAVSNYMLANNPAYKDPNYKAIPTPVPEGWVEKTQETANAEEPDAEGDIDVEEGFKDTKSTKRSVKYVGSSVAAADSPRASSTPVVQDADGAGESFEGDSFQQAQDKMITEMMNLKNDDDQLISASFLNLPSRSLTDYYRLIKHPVCLKSVQKAVRGIKGRETPTGATFLKSWQAFEEESYFSRRLSEAKRVVAEPPQPKVKLTMKAAPEKITLKFGSQKAGGSAGLSVDNEALRRQQDLVKAGVNGQSHNSATGAARSTTHNPFGGTGSTSSSQDRPVSGSGEHGVTVNGIKREVSYGHSPALGADQPNGLEDNRQTPNAASSVMPPPMHLTPRFPSGSPHPQVLGTHGLFSNTHQPVSPLDSRFRPPGKTASDALIMNLNISTHPELKISQHLNLDVPASNTHTRQSITITLPRTHWYLRIRPDLSPSLMHRPSKTFVTCSNRRQQALPQETLDQSHPVYETRLQPGMNTIEVEVIAGLPRGAPKTGSGPEIELEKITVYVHWLQV